MSVEVWVSGPQIEVTLHSPSDEGRPLVLQGIIDTGASVICLDNRVARRLGLVAINKKSMEVADGSMVEATVYMAEIEIPALGCRDWFEIYALPMERPSNRMLIGRSFLRSYIVTYNGPDETFHYHKIIAPSLKEDWD